MGKKLYIGNLPFSANDADLESIFAQAGSVVSAKVVTDRDTGRSKGFGFVEMSTDDEAKAAVEKFNGADFEGRQINVAEAKTQEGGRPPRAGGRPGGGGFNRDRRPGGGGGRGGFGGGRGGFGGGNRGDR